MMTSNSPDSQEISLKIIEAIRKHPVLYISEVKGNAGNVIKLQEFRQKVWKRISDQLGLDPTWVKLKWKNLRDTYCRILKYKNKSTKGLKKKRWIFEDHLSFLKFPYETNYKSQCIELSEEYINDINTEIISSEVFLEQLEDQEDDDYNEYLEILENDTGSKNIQAPKKNNNNNAESDHNQISRQLAIDTYAKQIQDKFIKIKPNISKPNSNIVYDIDNTSIPVIANTQPTVQKMMVQNSLPIKQKTNQVLNEKSFDYNASIDDFFQSIAENVKKLPLKIQTDIKMDICKIVSDAEINYLKNNSPQKVMKYTNIPGMIQKLVLVPCHVLDNQIQTNKN